MSKDIESSSQKSPAPNPDPSKNRLLVFGTIPVIVADVAVTALGHPEAGYCITGAWIATCAAIIGKWGRP